jgi:OOP family OmpA-OmpF porin
MQRLAGVAIALVLLGLVARVRAQEHGYALNHLDLAERGSEWFATDSLDLRGHIRSALGVVGEWAYRPLVIANAAHKLQRSIVRNQFVLHPGVSFILWDRLRLAADLPVQAYADGHNARLGSTRFAAPSDKTSLGDLRLGVTLRLFGAYARAITAAFATQVALPTGDKAAYAGDGDVRVTPQVLLAGDIAPFVYAFKAGVTVRSAAHAFGRTQMGSYASYAASLGVRVAQRRLVIGPEFFGNSVLNHGQFGKRDTTPFEALLAVHFMAVDGLRIGGGLGVGLTTALGSPERRGMLSLEWVPQMAAPPPPPAPPADRDLDRILDIDDACPDMPGELTSDPATNGCPPPQDRDQDGVLDPDDACPDQPGTSSADPKTNGCPPPPDRDADGIVDADDACPDQPGKRSDNPKTNGCPPPPDRDEDSIVDADDACPDQPGNPDADPKRNGCPKAYVLGNEIKILDQVKFKINSAEIITGNDSEEVLFAVLQVLNKHPEITTLLIEGHTDDRGSVRNNRRLSQKRAESVGKWLALHGIAKGRLTADGLGPDRPIDSNETEQGRYSNRRVEFHIVTGMPAELELH